LTVEDVALLRAVRLQALSDAPDAFGSTYDREVAFTDDVWESRLAPTANPHFVDEGDDGDVRGLVAGIRSDEHPARRYLVAMWVAPHARATGVADDLVRSVIDWASSDGADSVRLHVMANNGRAERVYERHGFVRTGRTVIRERDGLAEVEMELRCR